MPEYLSPGVYIEEVDSGPRPIEAVGTSTAAFVGFAPAGPVNKPILVTNWTQYVNGFASVDEGGKRNPHQDGTYMSHAVFGFFQNGGGRAYITRLAPPDGNRNGKAKADRALAGEPLQLPSRASKAVPSLSITPKAGVDRDINVQIAPATSGDGATADGAFTLKVSAGDTSETFENVSLGKGKGVKNVAETVTSQSKLVDVAEAPGTGTPAERIPETGTYVIHAQQQSTALATVNANDFAGDITERSGVQGLELAEDVNMVCCPDIMAAYQAGAIDRDGVKAAQLALIAHCERMGDRMAILDPLPDLNPQEVAHWRNVESNFDSKYAALYYPWVKIAGPDGKPMAMPPSGHMAGIYARSDNTRGVHKAPANEVITGALEPTTAVTKGEQDILNPIGVNCIRTFTGRGVRVWGARTLSSDPAWRYINVRRLFNFVEKSIENGTQWVVFEPNDMDLWARVSRDITAFLSNVWRTGALFGASPAEAFFVKCDAELNPPEVRDVGQLYVDIGLAPVKPAEFIIFRLSQWAQGGA